MRLCFLADILHIQCSEMPLLSRGRGEAVQLVHQQLRSTAEDLASDGRLTSRVSVFMLKRAAGIELSLAKARLGVMKAGDSARCEGIMESLRRVRGSVESWRGLAVEAGGDGLELIDVSCVMLKRVCMIVGKLATRFYGLNGNVGSYTLR